MITSPSNPQIKNIRKLRDRKFRNVTNTYFVEGTRLVIEAINNYQFIDTIIVSEELITSQIGIESVMKAETLKIPILRVSKAVFESISGKDGPQGLAAVVKQKWMDLTQENLKVKGVWIGLYEIADPGNLGTIIRTLDGIGGTGIILIDHCTDPYDPTSIRASMGAIFSKEIYKANLDGFIRWADKSGTCIIGTSDASTTDYRLGKYQEDMIILMGSEREGLPSGLINRCDQILSIPMLGQCDSLNLSVAASIMMYEVLKNTKETK
jgi:TrmH family RNA methyltransferase